jgi:transcriptional regulator with XRE-family HTH domain
MQNMSRQAASSSREAVLTQATIRVADRLNISGRQLADIIGVSEAQISRFRKGDAALADKSKPFELAALLVRAYRSLDAIAGGDDRTSRAWLMAYNSALGSCPADRIATAQGLVNVVAYLDARCAPI